MSRNQPVLQKCTLAAHRAEADTLLAPLITRIQAHPGEEMEIQDPALVGRVLAREYLARIPIPAFDNSQMDGYAVRAADLESATPGSPTSLPVAPVIAAGDSQGTHSPGTASPIMTGAAIPTGADAIVPIEQAIPPKFPRLSRPGRDEPGAPAQLVEFVVPVKHGWFIRRRGEDLTVGTGIGAPGTRVTPALIGALAATGISRVSVRPRARVLLCSTGDELIDPSVNSGLPDTANHDADQGEELQSGRIYDSNTPMLRATLTELGAEVTVLRTRDDTADFIAAVNHALIGAAGDTVGTPGIDLIVTMGGISQGAFEVVREAFQPLGIDFHPVAIQPGGPQGLGSLHHTPSNDRPRGVTSTDEASVPVLCFPGNPVSAILSLELFLAPSLRALAGLPTEREAFRLPLAHGVESPPDKHQIRRATVDDDGRVTVFAPGSHLISELAAAHLLAHFPIGVASADADTLVDTWRFND